LTETAVPVCTAAADVAVLTWSAVRDGGLP
jgi:hypothetical protein